MIKMIIFLFLVFLHFNEYNVRTCDYFKVNNNLPQEKNDLIPFCLGMKGNFILETKISEHFGMKKILEHFVVNSICLLYTSDAADE